MINIKTFHFNDLRVCTYVLWDETKECAIVDPGCHTQREQTRLEKFISDNHLNPIMLLNTHGHFDHVMGNAFVSNKWSIKTYIHPEDKPQLERSTQYGEMFGYNIESPPIDIEEIEDGHTLELGNTYLKVIHTPGHTRGGVCFYNPDDKIVFSGDSLFEGSIGRTDLPGGNYEQLLDSLLNKVVTLGKEYVVYPGHGAHTNIEHELRANPFLRYE